MYKALLGCYSNIKLNADTNITQYKYFSHTVYANDSNFWYKNVHAHSLYDFNKPTTGGKITLSQTVLEFYKHSAECSLRAF